MCICLGMKPDGTLLNTSFKECHHLIIGGYSGCGKTKLVNNILAQLSNTKIYIFDIKAIDYKGYTNNNNEITLAYNSSDIKKYLNEINDELHNLFQ